MSSDSNFSLFAGSNLFGFRGHANNTHPYGGERTFAPDSKGSGVPHGVVVYDDGLLRICPPQSAGMSEIHFHRLIIYHSFYKVIRMFGLEKATLLKSPGELTLRFT